MENGISNFAKLQDNLSKTISYLEKSWMFWFLNFKISENTQLSHISTKNNKNINFIPDPKNNIFCKLKDYEKKVLVNKFNEKFVNITVFWEQEK